MQCVQAERRAAPPVQQVLMIVSQKPCNRNGCRAFVIEAYYYDETRCGMSALRWFHQSNSQEQGISVCERQKVVAEEDVSRGSE